MDANGAYLQYREMAAPVPLIAFVSFGLALALTSARGNLEVVGAILLLEYVVLMLATRNAGTRLISNVLAVEAAISGKYGGHCCDQTTVLESIEGKIKVTC